VALLSVVSLLFCTAVLASYAVRAFRFGRARHERLGPSPGSAVFPGWLAEAFYWALQAPARGLARLGVHPDVLTFLALAASLASVPLIASDHLPAGALLVGLGGCFDAVDGVVARLSGKASPSGAVLDAALDRISDSAPFAGLAVVYRGDARTLLVPIAALVASSLVSYARARADVYRLALPNGPMRRHERLAYLLLALLVAPLFPRAPFAPSVPYPVTLAIVAFIAIGSFVAAFLLVARTRAALEAGQRGA
jgi:CDP-diacylglycerol--glycerol-3-phosphate 3-phosphatidyltransferase